MFVHVTYVPFIKAAGELKTKPTQQSVAKLREIGIAPQILVCRCEKPLEKELRQKISMFCNVPYEAVVEERDVDHSIYEVPLMLQRERVDELVCRQLQLDTPQPNMAHWQEILRKIIAPQHRVRIGVVGKYIELQMPINPFMRPSVTAASATTAACTSRRWTPRTSSATARTKCSRA